jgi:hypothetical protein
LKIVFADVKSNAHSGNAKWIATYNFSKTNRQVINAIQAKFAFQEDLIIKHTDTFDVWKRSNTKGFN